MCHQTNNRGFTLVELLVAITIMAIGVLAVVQMQVVGMQSSSIANQLSIKTGLAHEVMEDIQSWDLNNPPVTGLFSTTSPPYTIGVQNYDRFQATRNQATINIPGAGVFNATYSVTLIAPDLNTAAVTVTISGGTGSPVILTSHRRIL
jgi:type IV pilus assembly protein PilV